MSLQSVPAQIYASSTFEAFESRGKLKVRKRLLSYSGKGARSRGSCFGMLAPVRPHPEGRETSGPGGYALQEPPTPPPSRLHSGFLGPCNSQPKSSGLVSSDVCVTLYLRPFLLREGCDPGVLTARPRG